jgi:hypothetical protein
VGSTYPGSAEGLEVANNGDPGAIVSVGCSLPK